MLARRKRESWRKQQRKLGLRISSKVSAPTRYREFEMTMAGNYM
jgi:hypothetical protein